MKKLIIHSDGGARGNPGPAGIGVIVNDESGGVVAEISKFLGVATNNQAEYRALIAGLEKAVDLQADAVACFLDSELVVKQINREYKVKNKELAPLFLAVCNLLTKFKNYNFCHIPRTQNSAADRLANEAMDKGQ